MPTRTPRICACGYRIASGQRCPCERARKAAAEDRRPTARQRGYTAKWEREAAAFLKLPSNRKCVCGCGRDADVVDHKIAHKGDQALFWNRSNWRPMNLRCNSRKAAREEGGFGNVCREVAP